MFHELHEYPYRSSTVPTLGRIQAIGECARSRSGVLYTVLDLPHIRLLPYHRHRAGSDDVLGRHWRARHGNQKYHAKEGKPKPNHKQATKQIEGRPIKIKSRRLLENVFYWFLFHSTRKTHTIVMINNPFRFKYI